MELADGVIEATWPLAETRDALALRGVLFVLQKGAAPALVWLRPRSWYKYSFQVLGAFEVSEHRQ